jgi:hypothetical protein
MFAIHSLTDEIAYLYSVVCGMRYGGWTNGRTDEQGGLGSELAATSGAMVLLAIENVECITDIGR